MFTRISCLTIWQKKNVISSAHLISVLVFADASRFQNDKKVPAEF